MISSVEKACQNVKYGLSRHLIYNDLQRQLFKVRSFSLMTESQLSNNEGTVALFN